MILGVSEWVAEKFNLETQQVRIGFVIAFFVFGVGILLYPALWVVKTLSKD